MPDAILVEDDAHTREAMSRLLHQEGFAVETAASLADARALLKNDVPGLVLTDLSLPDGTGIDFVRDLQAMPEVEVVIITGHASVETAIEALRLGASDYVTKPVDVNYLKRVLSRIHRTLRLREEIRHLRGELRSLGRFGRLIGRSAEMQKVYDLLSRVAPTDASVLLIGESGTGKELAAMTIHDLSKRSDKPFLALNCGAVPANMIESELFGHEKGSFTGAVQRHAGYFERASGGTLFLDEISEMQIELQVKLLRVLESGALVRIGGEKETRVDVRVIAASNRDPEKAVADGKLREDLYYRLRVVQVTLPLLRDRGEDIRILAEDFLGTLNREAGTKKSFTDEALEKLDAYHWPGNVRELKNIVHHAFILADDEIGPGILPLKGAAEEGRAPAAARQATDAPAGEREASNGASELRVRVGTTAAEAERRLILATLEHCSGNKTRAARLLGMSLKTLYNRLKSYNHPEQGEDADTAEPDAGG